MIRYIKEKFCYTKKTTTVVSDLLIAMTTYQFSLEWRFIIRITKTFVMTFFWFKKWWRVKTKCYTALLSQMQSPPLTNGRHNTLLVQTPCSSINVKASAGVAGCFLQFWNIWSKHALYLLYLLYTSRAAHWCGKTSIQTVSSGFTVGSFAWYLRV